MATIPEALNEALRHHQAGRLQQAEAIYRQILQVQPHHPEVLHNLGLLAYQIGQRHVAVDYINQAIRFNPKVAEFYNSIGGVYRAQGKVEEAVVQYRHALALNPAYAEAHSNLGLVLWLQDRFEEALVHFRKALDLNPSLAEAHNNLGNALREQGKLDEAEAHLQQALKVKPTYAEAYNNLGLVLHAQGKLEEAVAQLRRALALKPAYPEAYNNLGVVLSGQGKHDAAKAHYRQALALKPHDGIRIKMATLLPVIMGKREEVMATRAQFEENLVALSREKLTLTDPVKEVGCTNFYLAYHGHNNRELLVKMAQVYEQACPALLYTAPHCARRHPSKGDGKIKIGFLSRYFKNHSVAKAARGVLAHLSRDRFIVTALFVPPAAQDEIAGFIRQRADRVVDLPGSLQAVRERIAEEAFDILFYQDIGMDPFTYFLAFSRLAPVQCLFFGHAETSGIRNIDYFISSENIEPDNALEHYSETLVKLKAPCAYYYKPEVPSSLKPRSAFGLDKADHVYLCPQTFFKFHPDFDEILAGILEADSRARLVLKGGGDPHWAALLLRRFGRTMKPFRDRITVLSPQPEGDFINLIAVSDVMLDTLHFSGLTTSLEAFAVGTPVVTLPGEFQRGRLTFSLYKAMGILDCVADSPRRYIEIAVRLGTDAAYRKKIKAKIHVKSHRLYENMEVVREYERFFVEAVSAAAKDNKSE